jgi:anti-sigma B factor antagonist
VEDSTVTTSPFSSSGPPWLHTEVTADAQEVRARLAGELDLATADELTGLVDDLIRGGYRRLVLDLTDLSLCDARGLAAFVAVADALEEAGGDLTMTGLCPLVRELFEITALSAVLRVR